MDLITSRAVDIFHLSGCATRVLFPQTSLVPLLKKAGPRFLGAVCLEALYDVGYLFPNGFRTADTGVGDRGDFCRYRIALLFEPIYGYIPHF